MNTALPSAMWLPFAARVLRARSDRGLSRAELAATVGVSDDKLREVESAHCRPARSLVERVDTALGAEHQLVDAWAITLQAEAFPNEFGDQRELGVHAAHLWEYQPMAVPAFLRTREYSRAVLRPRHPDLSPDEVEEMVEEEMAHRASMTGTEGPVLRVVLNESALQRPQGGAAVLNAQRDFLADLIEAGIVAMGVIPEQTPNHPGLGGAFRLMEFADRPSMVYAFAAQGGDLTAEPEQVGRCTTVRDAIEAATEELTPGSALLTARWPAA
ncbi:helix-turn-helix domain-containing protein [Nocardiopsis akebiae]|uniref:Helix-turn-helix domain-containing protein n=1 Tax=Nocardiopsis akebiae TaxID=2831968 RepID=A0ABX8C6U8_9ACTN|nr:Scr1 family TA system antitoxin-like transcriptional regulator [Nocardiopsis akebiae]QUX30150.1 helix-turn-helix domain-containing protein [Nocardiopsis akebiae]